jgi:hypothetical protein
MLDGLTMCGSRIAAKGESRLATLGCLVMVQSKLYGLSASHAFERIMKGTSDTTETSANDPPDRDYSAEVLPETSALSQTVEEQYYVIDDVGYLLDDTECDLESTAPLEDETERNEGNSQDQTDQIMNGTVIFPSDKYDGIMNPDLDWALIEVDERKYQRPNTYIAVTGPSRPVFFSKVALRLPDEQRDIVVITSALNPKRGQLLPGKSYLGGINRPGMSEVWNIYLTESESIYLFY